MMSKLTDRDRAEGYLALTEIMDKADDYATAFGITLDMQANPEKDWADILDMDAVRNTPEMIAKREAAAAKREAKREAAKAAYETDARKAWCEGLPIPRFGSGILRLSCEDGGAMLRLKGGTVMTSWGASVPLEHAKRVLAVLIKCRRDHKAWHSNGHTIPVGHFRVETIYEDGGFQAGCHRFYWPEIKRFAESIGLSVVA